MQKQADLCFGEYGYGKAYTCRWLYNKKRGDDKVWLPLDTERNGELVGAVAIDESKELMLISDGGTLVRTRASEV